MKAGRQITKSGWTRRDLLRRTLWSAACTSGVPSILRAESRMLNIVCILMDDLGWRDLGCYGSTFYRTPNVDALARDGMRFTEAYAACPVCSPTRAAILTGRYPARIGLTDYLVGTRRGKLLPAEYLHYLPLHETTVAKVLREADYATASIGKWHLGPEPYYPEHHGFDLNVAGCDLGHPPSYFWPYAAGDRRVPLKNGSDGEYLTERLTREAVRFIEANAHRPFFLYLAHYAVHNPMQAPDRWTEPFKAGRTRTPSQTAEYLEWHGRKVRIVQNNPVYAGMIAAADDGVGQIVRTLKKLGLYDRTLLLFTSDNGGLSTAEGMPTSNYPLAGGKGWLYEGGIRVPLIIRWPGKTRPGSVCQVPVTSTDFFPTLLAAAGLPQMPELHTDGANLTPVLDGKRAVLHDALYWHYPHYSNQGCNPSGAIREGKYKLIEDYETGNCELFDLETDAGETRDLYSLLPETAARLKEKLSNWRRSVGARMPRSDAAPSGGTTTQE